MKIRLKGRRAGGLLQISGVNKEIGKLIPPYFEITIDLKEIKKREKKELKRSPNNSNDSRN